MNNLPELGRQLSLLRERLGITIPELAVQTGIKDVTLKNIESGSFLKLDLLHSILHALGYTLSFVPENDNTTKIEPMPKADITLQNDFQIAVLSHYIQCLGTPFANSYKAAYEQIVNSELFGSSKIKHLKEKIACCPFPPPQTDEFSFIDLFAGIGGFRLAMQSISGKCVFSSEWDKAAQQTYFENYCEYPFGDITDSAVKAMIPDNFDVLCGGFPCQPFSLAGKKQGFENETQGTLFFDIMQIIHAKRPKVVFLENVRNLVNHDKGKTFKVIQDSILAEGYSFNYKVIDASSLVPQKRVRCYMVCVRDNGHFTFPDISGAEIPLSAVLENNPPDSYTLSDAMWEGHQRRTKRNLSRGTGFTAFTADVRKPAHTLVARYYKDGKECLIPQEGRNPRMLTPRECARLQGFPESFRLACSKTITYKQMGNSVAVPVLTCIAESIYQQILSKV